MVSSYFLREKGVDPDEYFGRSKTKAAPVPSKGPFPPANHEIDAPAEYTKGTDVPNIDPRTRPPLKVIDVGSGFEVFQVTPGRVCVIGAAPGTGKTALSMQLVIDALRSDPSLSAVIANIEMPAQMLMDRQLARVASVPLQLINEASPVLSTNRDYSDRLDFAIEELRGVWERVRFVKDAHIIENTVQVVEVEGPDIVVLDYCQKINPRYRKSSAREDVNEVMRQSRAIATDSGAFVFAIAACSRQRGATGSNYNNLTLASFRESGDLEYSADQCWVAYPVDDTPAKAETEKRDPLPADVRLIIADCVKNRHGELQKMELHFRGETQKFNPAIQGFNGVEVSE